MPSSADDPILSAKAKQTSKAVLAGIAALRSDSVTSHQLWLERFLAATHATPAHCKLVWTRLPGAVHRLFLVNSITDSDSRVGFPNFHNGVRLIKKWQELDATRGQESPQKPKCNPYQQDTRDSMRAYDSVEPKVPTSVEAIRHPISFAVEGKAIVGSLTFKTFAGTILAGALLSWLLSPFGWIPPIILVLLVGKVAFDLISKRNASFELLLGLTFMSSFIFIGILHDVYFDPEPTAQCRDGWYSYSASRSGTCSWHDGVRQWYPTLHHWWQTITELFR